jgi:TRAP-type C4-dicarboxylate transport system substrate-binding protein
MTSDIKPQRILTVGAERLRRRCTLLLVGLLLAPLAFADGPVRIKLATLVPKGSTYHRVLQDMGEAFRGAEGNGSTFTIYTDGSQGSEADVVRRMRVGQLNAALMSVIGLSEIDGSVSALQKMPMVFRSWEEIDYVSQTLRPSIERHFLDKGFVVVLWAEAGWVRFFSKQPAARPEDLKPRRMFAWAGDNEQVELMKALGFRPVVLETADIIPGLQTGLVDTVAVTPMWALATQLDRLAPYMIDVKWAPIVGALVVTRPSWEAMTPAARSAIQQSARQAVATLRAYQSRADDEAISVMEQRGLRVRRLSPRDSAAWEAFAQSAYPLIRGHMVPEDGFDATVRLVAQFRHESHQ